MNELNREITSVIEASESTEFHLMSETLSSINFEDKLSDGQYVAICYFATLHNVTPFEVVGIDGKEGLERYIRGLNDDVVWVEEAQSLSKKSLKTISDKYMDSSSESEVWFSWKPAETMVLKSPHSKPENMTTQEFINGKWETVRVNDLKSKESDTGDATRKFREAGIIKASELKGDTK